MTKCTHCDATVLSSVERCEIDAAYETLPAALTATPAVMTSDPAPDPCSYLSVSELLEWLYNPQWTNGSLDSEAVNHMSAAAELLERFLAIPAAPPEQPATSDTVKMFVEAIYAKNARIAQLEEALGKAVLSEQPAAAPPAREAIIKECELAARGGEIGRLYQCISMAMGCLDAESKNPDERLAWLRLLDGMEGREPRFSLASENKGGSQ